MIGERIEIEGVGGSVFGRIRLHLRIPIRQTGAFELIFFADGEEVEPDYAAMSNDGSFYVVRIQVPADARTISVARRRWWRCYFLTMKTRPL